MGGVQVCQRRKSNSAQDVTQGAAEAGGELGLAWSADDFLELCCEGQEKFFKSKARLLTPSEAVTVASAVVNLNNGRVNCPEGFCVVHSMTRGLYFLLWRKDMKSIALENLGFDEEELVLAAQQRQEAQAMKLRPRQDVQAIAKPREFRINLERSAGSGALGIDVQPEENRPCLFIEGISADGLVAQWNAKNPYRMVRAGDSIAEANGKRGDTAAIISQCKESKCLELVILSGVPAHLETPQRQDASCNTTPMVPLADEVRVPVQDETVVPARSSSDSNPEEAEAQAATSPSTAKAAPALKEYTVMLDRTDGAMLGVDVVPGEIDPILLIEGISEGLVQSWNEEHPDLQVAPGDRICEVNGVRGNLKRMIDQCKMNQELQMKIQRVV